MLYEVQGNLVEDEKYNIFCHQTNCMGVMGSGLALQIATKYPVVVHRNKEFCEHTNALGRILVVRTGNRMCVNLYGQYDYGRLPNKVYTDYDALRSAFDEFARRINKSNIPDSWIIGVPYKIGCGLAHGSWHIIHDIIKDFAEEVRLDVYIVRLGGKEGSK